MSRNISVKPENKDRIEQAFSERTSNPVHDRNERRREEGKSFTDAMCEVSIASGNNGGEVLKAIKKAGR